MGDLREKKRERGKASRKKRGETGRRERETRRKGKEDRVPGRRGIGRVSTVERAGRCGGKGDSKKK
jgi:hypothetical protein